MNLLLTSVGRRSYLVEYFKEALNGEGQVHVMNSSELSPAFQVADKATVSPLIYDEKYIPFLLEYCKNNDIKAVISLFDIDLPILAKNKEKFEEIGVKVIVADYQFVQICNDKWKTYNFLVENGFDAPKTYIDLEKALEDLDSKVIDYPVIIKPRWGMGSISIFEADNEVELKVFYDKIKRDILKTYLKYESLEDINTSVIIQEKIKGQEYGLDIINDLNGLHKNTIVKMKYAMRSGETDCAVTKDNKALMDIGAKLAKFSKHPANLDVDVFVTEEKNYVLEMNVRFGGGYPFSHMAGVNLPQAIVNWLKGEAVDGSILTAKNDVMFQKDIKLTRIDVKKNWEIKIVDSETEAEKAIEKLEKNLTPSLTDRGINIKDFAKKVITNANIWKVISDGKLAGVLIAYMNDIETKSAYLTMLSIDDSYRGLGLGKKLMTEAEKEAIKNGMENFKLEVRRNNTNGIGFYEKLGYSILGDADTDSYYMIKHL